MSVGFAQGQRGRGWSDPILPPQPVGVRDPPGTQNFSLVQKVGEDDFFVTEKSAQKLLASFGLFSSPPKYFPALLAGKSFAQGKGGV